MPAGSSQLAFRDPEGMEVRWDVTAPGKFDSEPLVVPARYSFGQSAIYRLKISNIPGRPGVELYPTVEVAMASPRSQAFLDHSAVPIQFTEEDFDQVLSGNFVTKVVYLPNPEYQELALAGVDTLVSTRLDPGVDPIREASRRGAILAVVRLGNKDLQSAAAGGEAAANGITQTGFHVPVGGFRGPARGPLGTALALPSESTPPCRKATTFPASPDRSMECRCAARRSVWSGRRTSPWERPPDCKTTPSSTTRTSACRNRRTGFAST